MGGIYYLMRSLVKFLCNISRFLPKILNSEEKLQKNRTDLAKITLHDYM